jgi:uncharacterized cupin superfamily protein
MPSTFQNMGIDLIDMNPGTAFPLHTHPGAHILFILKGEGTVTIGEEVYATRPGDCYFIPGDLPHGVGATQHHKLLAIGFPHKGLENPQRMDIVEAQYLQEQPMIAKIYSGEDVEERRTLLAKFQKDGMLPSSEDSNE